jgi:hypothetical protein
MQQGTKSRIDRVVDFVFSSTGGKKIGYFLAIGIVVLVAGYSSYQHIRTIALIVKQSAEVASTIPLAIDGLLVACSLKMADAKSLGLLPSLWTRFGFWFGGLISLICNVASMVVQAVVWGPFAFQAGWNPVFLGIAMFFAALGPGILLIATEVMMRPHRPAKKQSGLRPRDAGIVDPPGAAAFRQAAAQQRFTPVAVPQTVLNGSKPAIAAAKEDELVAA